MSEESELRKLFEEQRQWGIERLRKRTKTIIIIMGFILLVGLLVVWRVAENNMDERIKAAQDRIDRLESRRAAEKFQRDFADSLQRVENQKKLEEYLKRYPSERAKIQKK